MIDYDFRGSVYFPTLGIRPSEMRALEELPESTKDRLTPVVLFAPWVGSKHLKNSVDRLKTAFDSRPFYLDLDTAYESDQTDRPAVTEFAKLFEDDGSGPKNYYDFVESIPNAIPVLRVENNLATTLDYQLERINTLERGFMVRLRKPAFDIMKGVVLSALFETGLSNYVISLDCEWSEDIIECERWCREVIDQISIAGVSVPIITSVSSFPKSFSDIEGIRVIPINSRILYDNIRRRYSNELEVFYGDWGTTKPREKKGGRTPPARIDYVSNDTWVILRKKDEWDYLQAAQALIESSLWNGDLHVWGSLMIEKTAAGDVSGITSPAKNVAARVNLHLHQQAWFDEPNEMLDTDDPWDDDL